MTHLREEDVLDIVMGEGCEPDVRTHLASCASCQERVGSIREGLSFVRDINPSMPTMRQPKISFWKFKRRQLFARASWLAAASLLLFSLLGLRFEVNGEGLAVQFALFGRGQDPRTLERVAALEDRLIQALELNATLTQHQIDARLNAFYADRGQDFDLFSNALNRKMERFEQINALYLVSLQEDVAHSLRERELKGKLQ